MSSLRRWLTLLLIVLLPVPSLAGLVHCAGHASAAGMDANTPHADSAGHANHGDSVHYVLDTDSPAPDRDAGQHASVCCSAVLPAPTCARIASPGTDRLMADDVSAYSSAEPTPLRRPPRPSLA